MARRHLTDEEIELLKKDLRDRKNGIEMAFPGISAIAFNILLKEEKFSEERVAQYNGRLHEYYDLLNEYGQEQFDLMIERYNKEFPDKNDLITFRDEVATIKVKGNPLWWYERERIKIDNQISAEFEKYMVCHMNTLLDMEVSKKRIQVNRKKIVDFINEHIGNTDYAQFVKDLEDEYGIVIEVPHFTDKRFCKASGEFKKKGKRRRC